VDNSQYKQYLYGLDLISQQKINDYRYYQYDGLGSTRALTDATGTLTDQYNYDAFGTLINQTGNSDNDYLYTGEQYDSELDQYYLRARYYDQGVGRFTQLDTWAGNSQSPITLNKYLYGNADPVMHTDPTGRFSIGSVSIGGAMMGALAVSSIGAYSIGQGLASPDEDFGYNDTQKGWLILASMAGSGSSLLDLITSKIEEDNEGSVIMYHGSSIDSLVSLLNGSPLSAAVAKERKFPNEGSLLGFYLTPDYDAAEFFGIRRGSGVIRFEFTKNAFQAVRAGSIMQPIPPIGSSTQSPGIEMIVRPVIFPLFDSLRESGQITVAPAD